MKFKFTTQTCLVIAGLATTAYATCYYQQTASTSACVLSGTTVDATSWPDASPANIIATADWNHGYQNGHYQLLTSVTTAVSGDPHGQTTENPTLCYGPVKIYNYSTATYESISFWENNTSYATVPGSPLNHSSNIWGVTNSSSCM